MSERLLDDISYSCAGFLDCGLDTALDAIADAGFPQTELLSKEPHVARPFEGKVLSKLRDKLESRGVRARTVHAPSGPTVLGVTDEDWRRKNVIELGSFIRFAGAIGATDIVIHPIPNPIFVDNPDDPSVPQLIREGVPRSLDDLVAVAEDAGVRMNLENLPYHCNYPFLTMHELRQLVDGYPDEQVGLILDTGHVGVLNMNHVAEIRAAGDRLRGTHLHDVDFSRPDGDHRPPTHGGLDWEAIRRTLSEVGYEGPWTFEVAVPCHDESPEEMARISRDVASTWGL